MNIEFHVGDVPARTQCEIIFALQLGSDEQPQPNHLGFVCIDCGYATYSCRKMMEHQEHQADVHTIWQRLRRWWDLRRS